MKKLLLIIGVIAIGLWFNPTSAHAQDAGPEDCERTLFENEFICQKEKVYSYCSTPAKAEAVLKGEEDPSGLTFYRNVYCNTTRDTDDEIYEILAEQFQVEGPNYNADLIECILTKLDYKSIDDCLEESGAEELPASLETRNFEDIRIVHSRIKRAYDNEKIIHQAKASLKQELNNHEIWANGTLSDSPFDLIVDLNLIEIVLFGSRAQWVDDIYYFPEDEGEGPPEEEEAPPEEEEEEEEVQPEEEEIPPEAEEYECVPEELEGLQPGDIPENCGNGELDLEEECDDGNNRAGDGCSENCLLESGTSLTCQDIEAVTFKQFPPPPPPVPEDEEGEEEPPEEEIPISCPPGTTPVKKPFPQSPNYPGPFVGGVLKNFPPSKRPDCPSGWSPFEIKIAGVTETADYKRCIPLKFCADFDQAKEFLMDELGFPEEAVEPIEAIICIEIKKFMRPESPYSVEEGCVDCHILAMNDVMDKMLGKNVAPLQNNMQAWGLSNRWGPNFTFDIVTSVKSLLKVSPPKKEKSELKLADLQQQKLLQDTSRQTDPNKDQPKPVSPTDPVGEAVKSQEKAEKTYHEELENYRDVGKTETVGKQTGKTVSSLLEQMLKSFQRLQEKYRGLATTTTFSEKRQCTFD